MTIDTSGRRTKGIRTGFGREGMADVISVDTIP
jgi:hypothetical protein